MARKTKVDLNTPSISANIIILRQRANMTQAQLAAALGVTQPYVGLIESHRAVPSKRLIPLLAAALKTKQTYFQEAA